MDSDEFDKMFGDFDADKIAFEEAAKSVVALYKIFMACGDITSLEAATLVASIIRQGGLDGETKRDSEPGSET